MTIQVNTPGAAATSVQLSQIRSGLGLSASAAATNDCYRTVAGVVEVVQAPAAGRVTRAGGASLYDFSTSAPAMANGSAALDSNTTWHNRQSYALTAAGTGNMTATWTVSLSAGTYVSTDHYVIAVYNGSAAGVNTSGFSVSLAGAGGHSQSWSISGSGFAPGWNLIFLVSPSDTTAQGTGTPAGYGSQAGVVNLGGQGAGGMGGTATTSIALTFFSAAAGVVHYADCIKLSTKVKPAVMVLYDQTNTDTDPNSSVSNPFLNEVLPAFTAAGLVGACRFHNLADAAQLGNVNAAIAAGWQLANGTLTRATPVTTVADVWWQYAINQQIMTKLGLPHAYYADPPGWNTGSGFQAAIPVFRSMGIPFGMGNTHNAITHGYAGYGNPLSCGVAALDSITAAQALAYVDAAIACGTHIVFGSHFPQGSQTVAELQTFLAGLASRQAAGQISVVGPDDFARIMWGLL